MDDFILLRFQHDIVVAYIAATTVLPILYLGFSIRYKRTSYSQFSVWHHLGTCAFLLGPIINSVHDMAVHHTQYTVASEAVMATLMCFLIIGEIICLHKFVKTTWYYVTFTPYRDFIENIKKTCSREKRSGGGGYELLSTRMNDDDDEDEKTVPDTLKPFSWRKWFTIDLMLNWYCSQLLLTIYHAFMYVLRASSISTRNQGVFNNRREELAIFSGLTGGMTAVFVLLDLWVYRLYTYPNFLFYLTAMVYYFGCLTEYFVTVSRFRIDYLTVFILCALLSVFMVKIGVAQMIKSRYIEKIKLKEE